MTTKPPHSQRKEWLYLYLAPSAHCNTWHVAQSLWVESLGHRVGRIPGHQMRRQKQIFPSQHLSCYQLEEPKEHDKQQLYQLYKVSLPKKNCKRLHPVFYLLSMTPIILPNSGQQIGRYTNIVNTHSVSAYCVLSILHVVMLI